MNGEHICFNTTKLGSVLQVQQSKDPDGLRIFYYLVQVGCCSCCCSHSALGCSCMLLQGGTYQRQACCVTLLLLLLHLTRHGPAAAPPRLGHRISSASYSLSSARTSRSNQSRSDSCCCRCCCREQTELLCLYCVGGWGWGVWLVRIGRALINALWCSTLRSLARRLWLAPATTHRLTQRAWWHGGAFLVGGGTEHEGWTCHFMLPPCCAWASVPHCAAPVRIRQGAACASPAAAAVAAGRLAKVPLPCVTLGEDWHRCTLLTPAHGDALFTLRTARCYSAGESRTASRPPFPSPPHPHLFARRRTPTGMLQPRGAVVHPAA